ncbi:extracellular solute-binding protein [Allokutzneria multivorans]|uniref:Extracellular solute-binding protein n=1 Tax=Allokutzneria multivorans TaxID=1142134 RepID=A0ABP7R8Z3_9PSEU
MRKTLAGLTAVAVLTTACAGGGGRGGSGAIADPPKKDDKLTLTVFSKYSDREEREVTKALNSFKAKFPNIEIKHEGNQDDDKITGAVRGGNPPDVAMTFMTDNLGQFCSSGSWQNLKGYLDRDKVDLSVIPQAVRDYTDFKGTRCALPMLADVYGLFYNKDLFSSAGIAEVPKTTDQLLEAAKRLTQKNPDGSIKVAGFLPSMPFYNNQAQIWAPSWGARYLDANGKSALAGSAEWKAMFEFQKKLVEFYGYENLERFRAGLGQEYSADHAFQQGKLAMIMDGEYRTAFIADQSPNIAFGTAPFPHSPARPDRADGAFATGTIIGIPKGAKNPGAAWELIKHMTLETDTLVNLSNAIKNVPSTDAALKDPRLQVTPQFKTFIDLYGGGKLWSNPPTPIGDAHLKAVNDFAAEWQAGKVANLDEGLKKVDQQINDALAQSGK